MWVVYRKEMVEKDFKKPIQLGCYRLGKLESILVKLKRSWKNPATNRFCTQDRCTVSGKGDYPNGTLNHAQYIIPLLHGKYRMTWTAYIRPPYLPRPEIRPYEGLINHCFPLKRPLLNPLFLRGVPSGGYSFSHNHGSVENSFIWQVTILLEIQPFFFDFSVTMGGCVSGDRITPPLKQPFLVRPFGRGIATRSLGY